MPAAARPSVPAAPAPIETRRLLLLPADAALARAIHGDHRRVTRLCGMPPHRDFPDPALAALLPGHADDLEAGRSAVGWGLWLMVYKQIRMIVGGIAFKTPPDPIGEVEIGYGVVRPHQRRGLTSEGAAALLDHAMASGAVSRVMAECDPGNRASLRLLEKLGFQRLGNRAEAALRWELTRGAWDRRSGPPG